MPSTLDITVTNQHGLTETCYYAAAYRPTPVTFTNKLVNPSSHLTISAGLTVSPIDHPVVGQEADVNATIPVYEPSQALFTSPVAPDPNTLSFVLPALATGVYTLQTPSVMLYSPAVAARTSYLIVQAHPTLSAASGTTEAQTATTIADPTKVTLNTPTSADELALVSAFESYESMPSTCAAQITPGTLYEATDTTTNTAWAVAGFEPAPGCYANLAPLGPGEASRPEPLDSIANFGEGAGLRGVFERQTGGSWIMNSEGGSPFPCPALNGAAPGPGNGSLPPSVLQAWGLTYATDCANPNYPLPPLKG